MIAAPAYLQHWEISAFIVTVGWLGGVGMLFALVRNYQKAKARYELQAKLEHEQEEGYIAAAVDELSKLTACPKCHNEPNNSVNGGYWEVTSFIYTHCEHAIHSLEWIVKPSYTEMYNRARVRLMAYGKRLK